jgi:hypothetical protein
MDLHFCAARHWRAWCGGGLAAALMLAAQAAHARVTRIVIDERTPVPAAQAGGVDSEMIAGRAFGELDPSLPTNRIVQDIELAKDADGKVRYVSTFHLIRPVDQSKASGMMWHDVPNRGRRLTLNDRLERAAGDIELNSAWQGDNSGWTAVRPTMSASVTATHWLQLPIARNSDGAPVIGETMGRIINRSGPGSQPLIVLNNPVPYKPVSLDPRESTLVTRVAESTRGEVIGEQRVPPSDWAWARCDAQNPFPGTPDPAQICVKGGFDPRLLYQVTFKSADAYVLGIGFAAWRDVGHFFKTARADDHGTPNPVAGLVKHSVGRGISQSGNYLRGWLHLGFNQVEAGTPGQMVHDGIWPIIAGRRIALNFRWAQPDGWLELYQAGSEGPQWWLPAADAVRGGPVAGILDRCTATATCPKIIEHFGSAEVWALKLTPEWIGTDGKADLPLPPNVRRYYIPATHHGGGAGGFDTSLPGVGLPAAGAMCPGANWGPALLPANPVPHLHSVNAIREHFRAWLQQGKAPPPSRYPTLATGTLVPADKISIGFPTLPALRPTVPEPDFVNPVIEYDWGPRFSATDGSGVPAYGVPPIRRVLPMWAPKVDRDGNEFTGVPVVLLQAPLGTYLGWNITADGFHKGQICAYMGGMIPFARTAAERQANGDPRLSLEERYGNHAGYVDAVRRAAARIQEEGFLTADDAKALVEQAQASRVLR